MAESDVCASVVKNALMVLDVVSSRPCAALLLNSNFYGKYTCVCTGNMQQHMSPVPSHKYGAGTNAAVHVKLAVLI
jgi:hypothetical protein